MKSKSHIPDYLLWGLVSIGVILILTIIIKIISAIKCSLSKRKYKQKVDSFRKEQKKMLDQFFSKFENRIKSIPQFTKKLIYDSTLLELIDLLRKDKISYEEMYLVFFERTYKIGYPLNLCADLQSIKETFDNFEELKATKFDERLPLRNIPFSMKDQFKVGGQRSMIGFSKYIDNVIEKDGRGVKYLKEVFQSQVFLRGNCPQGNFIGESNNFIFGRALNPINHEFSTGGSSGGDAGLLAAGCIPFSTGADIGGSLRMPASFCGVITLKCTPNRIGELDSFEMTNFLGGQIYITAAAGFFTKDVADLEFLMHKFFSHQFYKIQSSLPPIPWRRDIIFNQRYLRIAFIESDDVFPSCKAVRRCLNETVAGLRKSGHKVIPTIFPKLKELACKYISIMSANDGVMSALSPNIEGFEDYVPEYKTQKQFSSVPKFLHKILPHLLKLANQKRLAEFAKHSMSKSVMELFLEGNELLAMREEFHQWMLENEYDSVILPVSALTAFRHGQFQDLILAVIYTFIVNSLDVPAGIIPIGEVKEDEEFYTDNENDMITNVAVKTMKGSKGMPISAQILGRAYQEEMCLKTMFEIEKAIGKKKYKVDENIIM